MYNQLRIFIECIVLHMLVTPNLVPGPLSVCQCFTQKTGGPGIRSHVTLHHDDTKMSSQGVALKSQPLEAWRLFLKVYFLALYSLKQLYYSCLIVSKPYLWQIVNSNSLNFADLWLTHTHFHPLSTLHTDKIGHLTSDTRPSGFSMCNIKKLGVAWERG